MATYIYVIKETLRYTEDAHGHITRLGNLTIGDYVAAVRAGPGYGAEPEDPRGNLVSLPRYLKDVQTGPVDTLRLRKNTIRYALLIFGSLQRGKVHAGLTANADWNKVGVIEAGWEPVKCMVSDGKFGTQHDKMLMMVASAEFSFPQGMKEVHVASQGRLTARLIDTYFRSFRN